MSNVARNRSRVALDLVDHRRRHRAAPLVGRRVRGEPRARSAISCDVLALVAVLGRLLAARPRPQRRAEQLHLAAGVVEVVLALDRRGRRRRTAAPASRRRRRCGRSTAVTGPVGLPLTYSTWIRCGSRRRAGAVAARPGRAPRSTTCAVPRGRHAHVDEPRPGDLDRRDPAASRAARRSAPAMSRGDARSGFAPAPSRPPSRSRRGSGRRAARARTARRRRRPRRPPRDRVGQLGERRSRSCAGIATGSHACRVTDGRRAAANAISTSTSRPR